MLSSQAAWRARPRRAAQEGRVRQLSRCLDGGMTSSPPGDRFTTVRRRFALSTGAGRVAASLIHFCDVSRPSRCVASDRHGRRHIGSVSIRGSRDRQRVGPLCSASPVPSRSRQHRYGHARHHGNTHADDLRTLCHMAETSTHVAPGDVPLPSRDAWALVHERDRQQHLVYVPIELRHAPRLPV